MKEEPRSAIRNKHQDMVNAVDKDGFDCRRGGPFILQLGYNVADLRIVHTAGHELSVNLAGIEGHFFARVMGSGFCEPAVEIEA